MKHSLLTSVGSRCSCVVLCLCMALCVTLCMGASSAHAESDRLVGLVTPLVAQKPLKIGVTLVHLNDTFWKGVAYGIVDEAKRSNVQVVRVSVAGGYGKTREQFAQLNTLKTLGVNYVALGAASFDGYEPMIRELKTAGIKVIAAAIPVNSASVAFGVTQDDSLIGKLLADAICTKNGSAKIVAIPGPAGAEWARLRYVGFMDELKHCPGAEVYPGAFRGSVDLQEGLSQTADLLLKHPEANFVYTPQMSLGLGAVQAGRQLSRHVQVVSSAVVKAAVPMLIDGRLLGVISEPAIIMGRLIVQYLIRDAEGKPMPNFVQPAGSPYPYFLTPPTLITVANAASFPLDVYEIPPADFKLDALQ
ncbi:MAG: putative sugar transport system, substrate-binding protein [Gammaproteobacteria bacterium]|nr:putative sugar transport system, substrate-binding protein [Gammaproteobacteria bacterium]